jgi:hypothetical protein
MVGGHFMDEIARIRGYAEISIGRASAFGLLAIATTSFGLIGWPVLAFKLAAVSLTLAAAILSLKGAWALDTPYKRTELWLLLERRHDLPEPHAQRVIGNILRDTYRRFALYMGAGAVACWCLAFASWLLIPTRSFV